MKKRFILLASLLIYSSSFSQVGINTTTPNGATVLDIHSEEKGVTIPSLTETQRNTKLADNDPATDENSNPQYGIVNPALKPGTLIFNTTANRFEFWDGKFWRQLFVATSSEAGNDGVVRIDGGAGGVKPTMILAAPSGSNTWGPEKEIIYTTPLTFAAKPTTSWPETVGTVPDGLGTEFIYVNQPSKGWQFIENPIPGQVHIWRLVIELSTGSNSSGAVQARLYNPNPPSTFQINSVQYLPSHSNSGNILTFYFYTIADNYSIGADKGYKIALSTQNDITVIVRSLTRVSLFKD